MRNIIIGLQNSDTGKFCGSYIGSPDWIKHKKATTNPKNEDHKCFQHTATIALNYEKIELYPEKFSNI